MPESPSTGSCAVCGSKATSTPQILTGLMAAQFYQHRQLQGLGSWERCGIFQNILALDQNHILKKLNFP